MGVLSRAYTALLKLIVLALAITFIPGIPPDMEFESYSISPAPPLEGVLSLNDKLNEAEKLFANEIKGPEHMEVHGGVLYTTLEGGYVVKIVGEKVVPLVKFGKKCDGVYEPEICGRPLGLSFDGKNNMYVADAYYGVFKVDLSSGAGLLIQPAVAAAMYTLSIITTPPHRIEDIQTILGIVDLLFDLVEIPNGPQYPGEYEQLVSMDTIINGKLPKLPNSLTVAKDGTLYWTDSSTTHSLHDGLYSLLGNGNGRLIKYNPETKSNTVLIDKLHFANGVALSQDESFILVSDLFRGRILRHYLKGSKRGQTDVFLDGLPGCPDNMHSTTNGEFYVTFPIEADSKNPSMTAILGPYPLLRRFLARLLYVMEMPSLFMNVYYPSYLSKIYTHWVGSFTMLPIFTNKRTTVLFFNEDGNITKSLHATDGRISSITDFALLNGHYYLGSYTNPYLARVKAT